MTRHLLRAAAALIVWMARLTPALVVGSLLFAFDGGLRWLGLFGLPLLLLALCGRDVGCGHRDCGFGRGTMPGHWPAP